MLGNCFYSFGHGFYGGGLMMLFPLLLIALIVYFVMKNKSPQSGVNPIDMLNTKYINGDISKEEYEEKLSVLKKNR